MIKKEDARHGLRVRENRMNFLTASAVVYGLFRFFLSKKAHSIPELSSTSKQGRRFDMNPMARHP